MSTNILITGSRAPAALELSRLFAEAGHRVFVADSIKINLCQSSRSVIKSFQVPPPRQNPVGFISSLNEIIDQEGIKLIIPTCEEIYTIAKYCDLIKCEVFCDTFEKLMELHDKWRFIKKVEALGLQAPKTWRIESAEGLKAFKGDFILKPVFSRFATHVYHLSKPVPEINVSDRHPWVVQEYLNGPAFCTYSVVKRGLVCAHATYPVRIRAGQGACIHFESILHPQIEIWIGQFVKSIDFTGQIAFDFIEGKDGVCYPIECNPRATSGVHLFSSDLCSSFFERGETIIPRASTKRMIGLGMLLYGFPRSIKQLKQWLKTMRSASDVIWSWKDPCPFLYQFATFYGFWKIARETNRSLFEASTYDIEWNDEL